VEFKGIMIIDLTLESDSDNMDQNPNGPSGKSQNQAGNTYVTDEYIDSVSFEGSVSSSKKKSEAVAATAMTPASKALKGTKVGKNKLKIQSQEKISVTTKGFDSTGDASSGHTEADRAAPSLLPSSSSSSASSESTTLISSSRTAAPAKRTSASGKIIDNSKRVHDRYQCSSLDFETEAFMTCNNCWCYVCSVKAKECKLWEDHCIADPENLEYGEVWQEMRDEAIKRQKEPKKEVSLYSRSIERELSDRREIPLTLSAWRLLTLSPAEPNTKLKILRTYVDKEASASRRASRDMLRRIGGSMGGNRRGGYLCGHCDQMHYDDDDDDGDENGSNDDDDDDSNEGDAMTDDDLVDAGAGCFSYFTAAKNYTAKSSVDRYSNMFTGFTTMIKNLNVPKDRLTDSGELINFVGRKIPKSLLTHGLDFPRNSVQDQLLGTFVDAILARLLKVVNKPLSSPANIISTDGFPSTDRGEGSNFTVQFEMDSNALDIGSSEKARVWLSQIQRNLGTNFSGRQMFSYAINAKSSEMRAGKLQRFGIKIKINVRKWFPDDTMPCHESTYSAEPTLVFGRTICPICQYASPVGLSQQKCRVCLLYTCKHDELIDMPGPVEPLPLCHELGEPYVFDMVLRPAFISTGRKSLISTAAQLLGTSGQGLGVNIPDPFTTALSTNQVKCFKRELGPNPKIERIKDMYSKLPGESQILLQSSFLGAAGMSNISRRSSDDPDVKVSSQWVDGRDDLSVCPAEAFLDSFLDMCISVKNPLQIRVTIEDAELTPEQYKLVPQVDHEYHAACSIRMKFQLFMNMNPVGNPAFKNGVLDSKYSIWGKYWNAEKMAISAFCTPRTAQETEFLLNDFAPNKPHGNLHLKEEDKMISSGGEKAGGYAYMNSGLVSLFQSIHTEALHLGMTPFGMTVEDPKMYPKSVHNQAYFKGIANTSQMESRVEFGKLVEKGMARNRHVVGSTTALLQECENLGYKTVSPDQAISLRNGLNVELRNYQKQSLRWALDQECFEGGIMAHISAPLHNRAGESVGAYFSPYTNAMFSAKPPDVRGGFICEEMGMGKTIITLGLILCNPAPALTNGPEADEAWGTFAPDALTRGEKDRKVKEKLEQKERDNAARLAIQRELNAQTFELDTGLELGSTISGISAHHAMEVENAYISNEEEEEDEITKAAKKTSGYRPLQTDVPTVRSRGTLVICPVSLVGQWCSEARSKLKGGDALKIHEYHGQKRVRNPAVLANFDLVVTTYETLSADIRTFVFGGTAGKKKAAGGSENDYKVNGKYFPAVHRVNWFRVVMDESHKSKGKSGVSESLYSIFSKRRWCVTGTPIGAQVSDLAGQCGAIGIPGLSDPAFWPTISPKNRTKSGYMFSHAPQAGTAALTSLLRRLMMRHSKDMKYVESQESLLTLPPKVEHIQWIKFSEEEEVKYKQLDQYMKARYERLIQFGGDNAASKHTIKLLAMVKDLQMVCSGGHMPCRLADILNRDPAMLLEEPELPAEEEIEANDADDHAQDGECSICLSLYDRPADTSCKHRFCAACIQSVIANNFRPECPLCRHSITMEELRDPEGNPLVAKIPVVAAGAAAGGGIDILAGAGPVLAEELSAADREQGKRKSDTAMISKVSWLVSKLNSIQDSDNTAKILVFSQFSSTLEWLQEELPRRGFEFRTLTGSMTMVQRKTALEAFQNDPPTTVFLLSMRAGAVGINLTQANHVIVLEPCLNKALEDQAIGRVHRMGQKREVHIYKVACLGTVEERILKLQEQQRMRASGEENDLTEAAPAPVSLDAAMLGNAIAGAGIVAPTPDGSSREEEAKSMNLPLTFNHLTVSSVATPAEGKHNLLAAGDTCWVPKDNDEAPTLKINFQALASDYDIKEVSLFLGPNSPYLLANGNEAMHVQTKVGFSSLVMSVSGVPTQIETPAEKNQNYSKIVVLNMNPDSDENAVMDWHKLLSPEHIVEAIQHAVDNGYGGETSSSVKSTRKPKVRWVELVFPGIVHVQLVRARGVPNSGVSVPNNNRFTGVGLSSSSSSSSTAVARSSAVQREAAVAVQQTAGSIQTDRAAVNRDQFDVFFGSVKLPATLLQDTLVNTWEFDADAQLAQSAAVRRPVQVPYGRPGRGSASSSKASRATATTGLGGGGSRSSSSSSLMLDELNAQSNQRPVRKAASQKRSLNFESDEDADEDEQQSEDSNEGEVYEEDEDEEEEPPMSEEWAMPDERDRKRSKAPKAKAKTNNSRPRPAAAAAIEAVDSVDRISREDATVVAAAGSESDLWTCPLCTFNNDGLANEFECALCQCKRPATRSVSSVKAAKVSTTQAAQAALSVKIEAEPAKRGVRGPRFFGGVMRPTKKARTSSTMKPSNRVKEERLVSTESEDMHAQTEEEEVEGEEEEEGESMSVLCGVVNQDQLVSTGAGLASSQASTQRPRRSRSSSDQPGAPTDSDQHAGQPKTRSLEEASARGDVVPKRAPKRPRYLD